ncbi:MAG: hypothetical protein GWN62_16990 [Aliifodinibius sp.]|nr:hypothetical protein [Fodinibius sp.]
MIIDLETDNFIYENPTESFEQIRPTMEAQALREVQDNICPECHHWDEVNAKLDNSEL